MYAWDPERHAPETFLNIDDIPRDHWLCEACRDAWVEAFLCGREHLGELVKRMGTHITEYTNPRAG